MKALPKTTLKEMVTLSSLRKPLVIAMMMMLAQQLTGINAVSLDDDIQGKKFIKHPITRLK